MQFHAGNMHKICQCHSSVTNMQKKHAKMSNEICKIYWSPYILQIQCKTPWFAYFAFICDGGVSPTVVRHHQVSDEWPWIRVPKKIVQAMAPSLASVSDFRDSVRLIEIWSELVFRTWFPLFLSGHSDTSDIETYWNWGRLVRLESPFVNFAFLMPSVSIFRKISRFMWHHSD